MNFRCQRKKLSSIILILLILSAAKFVQGADCNLRLDTFLLQKSDYPQNTPVKNARATATNLDTNVVLTAQLISGVPYFAKLPEGKYNLVVSKDGFGSTIKQINLNCKLTDDKNTFCEIIFLTNSKKNKIYRMWQIDYKFSSEFPSPALPSTHSKSNNLPSVIADEIAVNERAIYLPLPIFSTSAKKIKNELVSELTLFTVSVKVEIDEEGNVVAADAEGDFKELLPAVIESAKKAKFVPLKVNGKSGTLSGRLIYSFSKSDG